MHLLEIVKRADRLFLKKDVEKDIWKDVSFGYNGKYFARMQGSFSAENLIIVADILKNLPPNPDLK